jgi:hypothetical protein
MDWSKPNFLWMMYRSGWATKERRERIVARFYVPQRAERLDAQGRLVLIDLAYANDTEHYQQLIQHSVFIKGIYCSRHSVVFNDEQKS